MYHQCELHSGKLRIIGWLKGAKPGAKYTYFDKEWEVKTVYSRVGLTREFLGWVMN